MEIKHRSFGKGYESTVCIIIDDVLFINIDYIKNEEKTINNKLIEKVACSF